MKVPKSTYHHEPSYSSLYNLPTCHVYQFYEQRYIWLQTGLSSSFVMTTWMTQRLFASHKKDTNAIIWFWRCCGVDVPLGSWVLLLQSSCLCDCVFCFTLNIAICISFEDGIIIIIIMVVGSLLCLGTNSRGAATRNDCIATLLFLATISTAFEFILTASLLSTPWQWWQPCDYRSSSKRSSHGTVTIDGLFVLGSWHQCLVSYGATLISFEWIVVTIVCLVDCSLVCGTLVVDDSTFFTNDQDKG